ncbi:hypothetical protein R4Z09_12170 [Niallia oryzisoli]|uniref:Uncharacterized protein n=1 Tax=Niallia oryzisoli TaxID=1737571 RepID=A0ABZ2CJG6_9BACI
MNFLNQIIKILSDIESDSVGDILTILSGIASGLLTLVGLVSIFISINSQHIIQKLRELMWGIIEIPINQKIGDIEAYLRFRDKLGMYEQIYHNKKDLNSFVVKVTIFILIFCIGLWAFSTFFLIESNNSIQPEIQQILIITTGLACIFLVVFIFILNRLNNIPLISNLPNPEDFLDANELKYGINTLAIASMTSSIIIKRDDSKRFQFFLSFPFAFKNLSLTDERAVNGSMSTGNISVTSSLVKVDARNYRLEYGYLGKENRENYLSTKYCSYPIPDGFSNAFWPIALYFYFHSNQGVLRVTYEFTDNTEANKLNDESFWNGPSPMVQMYPTRVLEFSNNISKNIIDIPYININR